MPPTEEGFPTVGRLLWRPLWPVARILAALGWHLEVRGRPAPGPVVVAANHFSHLDPPLLAVALRRPTRFLALDELFGRWGVFDRVVLAFGAIPVSRTRPPLGAMKTALAHLGEGGTLGVFPEAARVGTWGERPPKRGAAWLAMRAGVSLQPAAVSGTDRAFGVGAKRVRRFPVRIVLCDPLHPADFPDSWEMIEAWRRSVDRALSKDPDPAT